MDIVSKNCEEAKFYAQIGWRVVPNHSVDQQGACTCPKGSKCKSPGKHPRLTEWQTKATSDVDQIGAWFGKWPHSNVGVALGPTSDLIDIEYDSTEGKETAAELLDDINTPTFKSSRSVHHLFAFPSDLEIPKAVVDWRGLELRFGTEAKGAQSIFPPSRHASGISYEWLRHPHQVGVADAPEWLTEALKADRQSEGEASKGMEFEFTMQELLESHPGAGEGKRHNKLLELVGRFIAMNGVNDQVVSQALAWGDRCSPPMDQGEVLRVVSQLCQREHSKGIPPEGSKQTATGAKAIACRPYSEIEETEVEWLWEDRIAIGKLSLLAGQPGLGKTFCSLDIAAKVSTGQAFCDGSVPPMGEVAILTCEDGSGDTIRPRLSAAGADLTKCFHIDGVRGNDRTEFLSLKSHLAEIEGFFDCHPDLRLFILDPISAFMGDKVDSHVNAQVRSVLGPLAELAERKRVALLGITHLSKGQAKAINAIIGSIAFVAASRSAFLVAPDNDDEELRLFLPIKNNLAKCNGLAFTITDGRCVWSEGEVMIAADDLGDETETPREEAKSWLEAKLSDRPMPAKWILNESRKDGISEKTLRRAGKELGVVHERIGEAWVWRLVGQVAPELSKGEWIVDG